MRIISVNVNGIRAAAKKGFFEWMLAQQADVICLQETKAQTDQLTHDCFHPPGYDVFFADAEKKGYSGVAIYTRIPPLHVTRGLGFTTADSEGRYIQCDFGALSVASVYLPSGTSGDLRQQVKMDFLQTFESILSDNRQLDQEFILCGDWNIAHKQVDLKNWRANQKHSGFLPEERAWLDHVFDDMGYVDAFRQLNQEPDQYTWWSNRGQAWAKNVGWRIDYQVITPGLTQHLVSADIYKEQRFSDHAPLTIDYDYSL